MERAKSRKWMTGQSEQLPKAASHSAGQLSWQRGGGKGWVQSELRWGRAEGGGVRVRRDACWRKCT